MVVAKAAIVHCPGVDALVAARAGGRCLFLRWGRKNCAGLAAWRADPNVVQGTDSLLRPRARFPSGMGSLRRELRFAYPRFDHGAVSSLAAEPPGGLLRVGNSAPVHLADLS